jgi:HD-GYP domain-containing protein (c-di-GMP phosphodiesterase class II)
MILMALEGVRPGMVLGMAIQNREGHTLLGPGMVLTPQYINRLRELGYWAAWIDDEDTRDISYEQAISSATRLATARAVSETFNMTALEVRNLKLASVTKVREVLQDRRFQDNFQQAPAVERLVHRVELLVGEVLDRSVLTGLGAIKSYNSYAFDHCLDVTVTATMIGRLAGYDTDTLKKLAVGCMLHDIGHVFLDPVFDRETPLTEDEQQRLREHTSLGYLFLRDNLRLGVLASHVAYQHHEWQDGSGYPRGLTGTNRVTHGPEVHVPGRINPVGEIAAIANFHDTASSNRPYRRALPPDQVWHLIRRLAGVRFNRELVDLFLRVLPPYPVGSQVVVTSGRWRSFSGVVASVPRAALDKPVIRVLGDDKGDRIDPFEIDLAKEDVTLRGVLAREDAILAGPTGGAVSPEPVTERA